MVMGKFFLKSNAPSLLVKICLQIQFVSEAPQKSFNLCPFSENKPKKLWKKQRRGRDGNPNLPVKTRLHGQEVFKSPKNMVRRELNPKGVRPALGISLFLADLHL
jgi:hypothetical protein